MHGIKFLSRKSQEKIELTAEVAAVIQFLLIIFMSDHTDAAMLDEVHFTTERPFTDDDITRLKDLEA